MSVIRVAGIGAPLPGGNYETNFDEDDGWVWEEKSGELLLQHDKFAPDGMRCVGFQYVVAGEKKRPVPAAAPTAPARGAKQSAA